MKQNTAPDSMSCPDPMLLEVRAASEDSVPKLSSTARVVVPKAPEDGDSSDDPMLHNLKAKTARGALVSMFGQGANFIIRMVSMVVLARLLVPEDFGLVGMVTACTGFLGLFRDAGLSMATVQRASITSAQTSMLFWINLSVGLLLAALCAALAPILVAFYHEPRLFWVTVVLGLGFVFNGASAQHRATLQRDMRFTVLTIIDIAALLTSIGVAVGMAVGGQRYWALVGMAVCLPLVTVLGVWAAGGWVPNPPRRTAGVLSMLHYGSTVTLNCVIVYLAYNVDKVLLGRFWGAEILGIYGRAYQLVNIPTDNLNSTIGQVAFPALSRLQNDPARLRSYFLKGYGLFLSLVVPMTTGCALFAEDIIRVFLGPKWGAAVPVFRLLVPTILSFALMNPHAWLLLSTGRAARSLKIALMIAPLVIFGCVVGLRYGPTGVAIGFSISTLIVAVPVILWSVRDTTITAFDELKVIMRPLFSILIGAMAVLAASSFIQALVSPLLRLIVANAILFGVYAIVLLFVMGQKGIYIGLLQQVGVWPLTGRRKSDQSLQPGET